MAFVIRYPQARMQSRLYKCTVMSVHCLASGVDALKESMAPKGAQLY